jgi:hypothetical protein
MSFAIGFNNHPPDAAALVLDMYDTSVTLADAEICCSSTISGRAHFGIAAYSSLEVIVSKCHARSMASPLTVTSPFAELVQVPLVSQVLRVAPGVNVRPTQHVDLASMSKL